MTERSDDVGAPESASFFKIPVLSSPRFRPEKRGVSQKCFSATRSKSPGRKGRRPVKGRKEPSSCWRKPLNRLNRLSQYPFLTSRRRVSRPKAFFSLRSSDSAFSHISSYERGLLLNFSSYFSFRGESGILFKTDRAK